MASSSTGPNYARRFLVMGVLILLAIVAYSAGWYWIAQQADIRVAASLEALERRGVEVRCAERDIRGYPFRIGLYCDEVAVSSDARGFTFSAGAFRSAAQVYDPFFLIGELDGPAQLETQDLPPLALEWEILRASARLTSPLPERLSLESHQLAITADETPAASFDHVEAHMRPNGSDLDLAWRFDGLLLNPALVDGRDVPALAGEADIAIEDGVVLAASGERSLRGRSGSIRNARLVAGDASLSLSGPFAVDAEGLVDAELKLSAENPQELSALLAAALPEFADEIETASAGLAALGDAPSLPLTISRGRVSIAFFELGRLPPL